MNIEYLSIISDIVDNKQFKKLQDENHHHCTTRYKHSCDVALKTYKVSKRLKLDYVSATRAALVHDFFYNSDYSNKLKRLFFHYKKSIENASKITTLSSKEKEIISSHMFPIGGCFPSSKEAFILDLCDDLVSIKEKYYAKKLQIKFAVSFLGMFLFSVYLK